MKRKLIILSLLVFTLVIPSLDSYSKNELNIRVRVSSGKKKVLLRVKGPYRIEAIKKDLLLNKGSRLRREYICPTNTGLKIGDKDFKIYGIRIIPKKDASIFVDKLRFRGTVDIIRTKDTKLLIVNHLDIEKYLYGVLYNEVPYYWPMDMLKAQAIAARTFAIHRISIMKNKDYDVTNDIYSQVYKGKTGEKRRTKKAVNSTKGKILTYNGKILLAYYHAICGGHTEDSEVVFGVKLSPLGGRKCPYCKGAPGMDWKKRFSYKNIEEKLTKYGIKVNEIKRIVEGKRDKSRRLIGVKISDKNGTKEIKAFKFRLAMGPNVIRSTNFTIKVTKRGVLFRGKGWGHGVGMCQWGGFGMAKRRFNYKKILEFYYPGSKIKNYDEII